MVPLLLPLILHTAGSASASTGSDSCSDESDMCARDLDDLSAWRPPSATAQRWLQRFGAAGCDGFANMGAKDAAEHLPPNEPTIVRKALRKKQRAKYDLSALLKTHGTVNVAYAHPAYSVLSQGNPEKTQGLAAFVGDMRYSQPVNASVVFDHAAHIGITEKFHGLPLELRDEMPVTIFSLGADGAGFGMHSHGATYLQLAHGHKLWLVARPGTVLPSDMVDPVWAHGFELLQRYERLAQTQPDDDVGNATAAIIVCLQPPGTAVYLPDGWLHATVNLGDAVALAKQSFGYVSDRMSENSPANNLTVCKAEVEGMLAHPSRHTIEDLTLGINRLMRFDELEMALEVSHLKHCEPCTHTRLF